MFKLIVLIRKRPELSRQEFIDYYDNRHVPLVHSLLPKGAAVHRRNFVVTDAAQGERSADAAGADESWDVISEVFYEDLGTAQAAARAMQDPAIRRRIEEDEERFIMRGSMRRFVVEVHETVFRPVSGKGV